ncbi:MAG TPA: XdhC family protein [Pyrinomonadaceae bacterium]|nr:XdhC family protein [Pyrinomonadaceae bacterium]
MENIFDEWAKLRAREEPFVLATVVAYKSPQSAKPGSRAIIKADGSISGWVGGGCVQPLVLREAQQALITGQPKLLTISPDDPRDDWKGVKSYRMTCEGGGSLEIYLEPFLPKPELLIVGHSPVAETIARFGEMLDFKVITDPSRINETTYVVVATMGNGDEEGLLSVLGTKPKYLGLVASEKKSQALFEYVREVGTTDEQIDLIKCPAGLEIGAQTMTEIALSVVAEIVQIRREQTAQVEPSAGAIDPICGMTVDTRTAKYQSVVEGKTIYFCCLRCKETFDKPPLAQLTRS